MHVHNQRSRRHDREINNQFVRKSFKNSFCFAENRVINSSFFFVFSLYYVLYFKIAFLSFSQNSLRKKLYILNALYGRSGVTLLQLTNKEKKDEFKKKLQYQFNKNENGLNEFLMIAPSLDTKVPVAVATIKILHSLNSNLTFWRIQQNCVYISR